VQLARLRRQDGFIRGLVIWGAIIFVVAVVVLDLVTTIESHYGVKQAATDAANAALSDYVLSSSALEAQQRAKAELQDRGMYMTYFRITPNTSTGTVATVSDTEEVPTYLFRYLTGVPWGIGPWLHDQLNPTATESSTR
jgi:hypothetical protein